MKNFFEENFLPYPASIILREENANLDLTNFCSRSLFLDFHLLINRVGAADYNAELKLNFKCFHKRVRPLKATAAALQQ